VVVVGHDAVGEDVHDGAQVAADEVEKVAVVLSLEDDVLAVVTAVVEVVGVARMEADLA
jgi:hypothetical protein